MDNNPTQTPVSAADPVTQPAANIVQEPPKGNKMLWITLGVVVLILVVGGVYWYITSGQKAAPTTVQPSPKPTASPQTVDTLEKDLNSVSLDDLDKEFSTVDTDFQGL